MLGNECHRLTEGLIRYESTRRLMQSDRPYAVWLPPSQVRNRALPRVLARDCAPVYGVTGTCSVPTTRMLGAV
jgi:hypothetical protein